jgi:DNA-binding NtrC family response regulator
MRAVGPPVQTSAACAPNPSVMAVARPSLDTYAIMKKRGRGSGGVEDMPGDGDGLTKPCVLLVDDDHAVAKAHARLLRRAALSVDVCVSSVLALKRISEGARFDVVICDGQMPELEGVDFFIRAAAMWPELRQRIVFLSGGLSDRARRFLDQESLPFFEKPLANRDELVALIRSLAGWGAGRPDQRR